ncbi:agmatine deiminase family protein [Streptomyces sp. H27-G5]|uniref:agmatine deiminase family protein n=1 Tax=Streptomyces sp. H27-G5 TaxID=2996698 RepID=UPI002D1E37F9|nr:agmatine deiminase family protein [Streptomyces sp. H27-G5]
MHAGDHPPRTRAIADFEPVVMIAAAHSVDEARAVFGDDPGVEVIELRIDDSWLRDSGLIFAYDEQGDRVGVDFRFNAGCDRHAAVRPRVRVHPAAAGLRAPARLGPGRHRGSTATGGGPLSARPGRRGAVGADAPRARQSAGSRDRP